MLSFLKAFVVVFLLYHCLRCVVDVNSPVIVVMSGSMEPAFSRGDLLILTNDAGRVHKAGDIVVYRIPSKMRPIPVVHRVHDVHVKSVLPHSFRAVANSNPEVQCQ